MLLDHQTYAEWVPALVALFRRSFKRDMPADQLRWRYLNNPLNEIIACIEVEGARVIANYSASPVILAFEGVDSKSALSMTTMTDPDYSGRGLFPRLASELYEHMAQRGHEIIWGFPNNSSHVPFIAKLGWKDIYEIPTMQLKLADARPTAAEATAVFDDAFELDYNSPILPRELIHVRKDKRYLRWRYYENPSNPYWNLVISDGAQVSSFCVVKAYGKALDIVDCRAADREQGALLIRQVIGFAAASGFDSLNIWAPRHHFIHGICERVGFANHEPVTYFGGRVLAGDQKRWSGVTDYSRWYLQMGDSDVY